MNEILGFPINSSLFVAGGASVGVFAMALLLRDLLASLIKKGMARLYPAGAPLFSAFVSRINVVVILVLSLGVGGKFLEISGAPDRMLGASIMLAVILQCGLWATLFSERWLGHYAEIKRAEDPSSVTAFGLLGFLSKLLIWVVVGLIALENLGVDISALVAGLGIGGIAIALAVQNVLGDLLASLSIILDKPFVLGDTIVLGDITGRVERIGVKTTHLRSLTGELIVVANSDLLSSRIRNFKRMYERRVAFTIGVVYDTDIDKIEKIPAMIRSIVEGQSSTRFDRAHLKNLGDSAITFEIAYYVLSSEYLVFMDTQQRVILAVMRIFQQESIEFAFPTQTVVLKDQRAVT